MLRRIFKDLILVSIVMIVFGLVLLFWPEQSLTTAVRIIGAGLAISGLASVFAWVRERASSSYFSLAGAVLSCVAGAYLIARPEGVIALFPTVMGLAILPPRLEAELDAGRLTREEIGQVFGAVLEDAGVFKWDDEGRAALGRFLDTL